MGEAKSRKLGMGPRSREGTVVKHIGGAGSHQLRTGAFAIIAGLIAFTLLAAPGYTDQPGGIAASSNLGPYPDPGNDLTDPGIPGNPPPPAGGIDAPGPGSPDSGVTLAAGPANFGCALRPGEQETECFRPQSGERYTVCPDDPKIYSFKIIESSASDGTLLRTTQFARDGCQVVSFPPNTIVTMVNDSPYQREYFTRSTFTWLGQSEDFLCEVRIHDPYFPDDWQNQTKCTWTGLNSWLAKFTNYGDRPVDVSEWYRGARHGRTEVRPGQPIVMPLHAQGEFYVGAGGPPGRPIKLTVTDYQIANQFKELWVRDSAKIQPGDNTVAVNLSPYPVRLSWFLNDRWHHAALPPNGRVETPFDIGQIIYGEKNYGNGEVARVVFLNPDDAVGDEYHIKTPPGTDILHPLAIVQVLGQKFRSVKLFNRGPYPVSLTAWFVPGFVSVGFVRLGVRETGILPLFDIGGRREAILITALISPPTPNFITTVSATDWVLCGFDNCYMSFAGTVSSLSGSATGLSTGNLRLQMRGRLRLTRSARGINLARANLDLLDLLDEGAGAGELAELALPGGVHLVPRWSRGPTTLFSEVPPPGAQPILRMQVTRRLDSSLDFSLSLAASGLAETPELCSPKNPSVTDLASRLVIYDSRRLLDAGTTEPWQCVGSEPQEPSALLLQ